MKVITNERHIWIDLLRGVAIILVVFGHQGKGLLDFFIWTSPIKMPLFFAISGFLFSNKGLVNVKKLFTRLAIPYSILSLIPLVILFHLLKGNNVSNEILNFIFGWFIPTFFFSSILFRLFVIKLKSIKILFLISFFVAAIGYIIPQNDLLRICEFKTILICQHYLVLGYIWKYLLRRLNSKLLDIKMFLFLLFLYIGLIFVSYRYFPMEYIDVHTSVYYNPIICYLLILSGLYITYVLIRFLGEKYVDTFVVRALAKIGEHSLVVFLTQSIAHGVLALSLGFVMPSNGENWGATLVYTVCMVLISTIIGVVCEKYCPFILGSKLRK